MRAARRTPKSFVHIPVGVWTHLAVAVSSGVKSAYFNGRKVAHPTRRSFIFDLLHRNCSGLWGECYTLEASFKGLGGMK